MSNSELDKILIHKYIKGTLNNEEMKMFRQESKRKDFRKKLLKNISVLKNINDANKEALLNKIEFLKLTHTDEEIVDDYKLESESTSDTNHDSRSTGKKVLAYVFLISAIVSALTTWFYLSSNDNKDVIHYAELYIDSESTIGMYGAVTRGNEAEKVNEDRDQFQRIVEKLVAEQNHSELIKTFTSAAQELNFTLAEKYIWATSLMKQGNTEKAIELLSEIIEKKGEFFIESLWLRSLCYASKNQIGLMKSDFQEIQSVSQYKKNEIDQLLASI